MNHTDIEYLDWTWNYTTGCTNRCSYCWARGLAHGRLRKRYLVGGGHIVAEGCNIKDPFSPRIWENRLREPCRKRKPSIIGVSFMGDLFDPHIKEKHILAAIGVAAYCHWHTFIFLTKQPQRMAQFEFPDNAWCGITMDGSANFAHQFMMTVFLKSTKATTRFVSYEPLLNSVYVPSFLDWIIIGAKTGRNAMKPKPLWVQEIINDAAQLNIPIFLKNNLHWKERRQEFPAREECDG